MTCDKLAEHMAHMQPGAVSRGAVEAEFTRRQSHWQKAASDATVKAARWTQWSVVAIAITSGLQALFTFLIWIAPHAAH